MSQNTKHTISNFRNDVLEISNLFWKFAQTHAHHGVGLLGSAADRAQMSPFRFVLGFGDPSSAATALCKRSEESSSIDS
jgi:hypothetical protein